MSARYTDAIYKISGKDGSIIWTLGGKNSSFVLADGFNFSKQHDARFLEETGTTETITFFDNGGDEHSQTCPFSSALLVTLDLGAVPMFASVRQRWIRPGKKRSALRGNFQLLPNGNAFVGWSVGCHISEHSSKGDTLFEAEFQSDRFVSYRAYKFNFTSSPAESPVLKAFAYGTEISASTTVWYVSWNGATEVRSWNFYMASGDEDGVLVGSKQKRGFETMYQSVGFQKHVYAEAVDVDGSVLGRTRIEAVVAPSDWNFSPDKVAGRGQKSIAKSEL